MTTLHTQGGGGVVRERKADLRGAGCGWRTAAAVARGSPTPCPASGIVPAPHCQAGRPPAAPVICPACRRSRFDPSLEKVLSSAALLTSVEACDVAAGTCNQGTPSCAATGAYQLL